MADVAIPTWMAGGYADSLDTHRATVRCHVNIDIGATGAPTLRNATGRITCTRVSAGLYRLAFRSGTVKSLQSCAPRVNLVAATTGGVTANLTTDSSTSTSAPLVEVTCYAAGGVTATDPANGNSLTVDLVLGLQS